MKTKSINPLLLYIGLFFLAWIIIRVVLLWNYFAYDSITNSLLSHLIKALIWNIPLIFYIIFLEKKNPISFMKLNTNIVKGLSYGIIVSVVMLLSNIVYIFLFGDQQLRYTIDWVGIVLIGLLEETPFRGFFLQKFQEYMSFTKANALQAFLFLLIHFPGWYRLFNGNILQPQLWLYIFGFGIFLGFILKRSNSLWSCIIIHSVNNLIATLIN